MRTFHELRTRVRQVIVSPVRLAVARSGLSLARVVSPRLTPDRQLIMTLEFAIAHLASFGDPGQLTAVQVGAHDGAEDPLTPSIAAHHLRALLLEPQPGPFGLLQVRHANNADVTLVNAAVAPIDGTAVLYSLERGPGFPDWASRIASFDRRHVEKFAPLLPKNAIEDHLIELDVTTVTFDTVLREAGIDRVDILQVDTEGYDLEVLRLFDVGRRLPSIVNFERVNLSPADQEEAVNLLLDAGYLVCGISGRFDTLAYRPPHQLS